MGWGKGPARCELQFEGGPVAHSADKGEKRKKKTPKKGKSKCENKNTKEQDIPRELAVPCGIA